LRPNTEHKEVGGKKGKKAKEFFKRIFSSLLNLNSKLRKKKKSLYSSEKGRKTKASQSQLSSFVALGKTTKKRIQKERMYLFFFVLFSRFLS
jgi:hypothetical protein